MFDEQLKFCKDTTLFHSFNSQTKGGAAYSKVKQSLLSNTKSVITRKQLCLPRLFRCMRSTGITSFARNVSVGNLRLKINCLLDLGRFVGKKLLAGRPSFRLVKNAFLKTFCNKYKRSFFFSNVTPLKSRGFNFRHLCFLVCFAWNFRIQIRGNLKMTVLNSKCLYKLAENVLNVSSAFRFVQRCNNYQINKKRTV